MLRSRSAARPQGTLYGKNTTPARSTSYQPAELRLRGQRRSVGGISTSAGEGAVSGTLSDTAQRESRSRPLAAVARSTTSPAATGLMRRTTGCARPVLWRPCRSRGDLTGDYSAQDAECCGRCSLVRSDPARRRPAVPVARGRAHYAPASPDPFDRLTDLEATLNAGNKTGAHVAPVWDIGAAR